MENKENKIYIIAQGFYGNRTATYIEREKVDFFLKGVFSPELFPEEDKTVDRKIVRVPNTENMVIVYDQNQENEFIKKGKTKHIFCEIPEIGLKLHSRCFACTIDKKCELQNFTSEYKEKMWECFSI